MSATNAGGLRIALRLAASGAADRWCWAATDWATPAWGSFRWPRSPSGPARNERGADKTPYHNQYKVRISILSNVIVKTVKLSSKGQLTLPAETLRALKARKGDEFVLVQEDQKIVLIPATRVARQVIDDLGGWSAISAPAFQQLWDNVDDEVWNEA